jgi:hypothetical protein
VACPAEDLFPGARLDNLALVHDVDPVAQVLHDREVMGDEQAGEAEVFLQVGDLVQDGGLDGDVEGGRRLVGHEEQRPDAQRPGQAHSLPLAAGKLVRAPVPQGARVQADLAQDLVDVVGAGPGALRAQRGGDDVRDGHARAEGRMRVLEDHVHLAAEGAQLPGRHAGDVRAVEYDAAAVRLGQAQHAAADGGLAAA